MESYMLSKKRMVNGDASVRDQQKKSLGLGLALFILIQMLTQPHPTKKGLRFVI
tara:strand:+ start:3837 stop:3998 length:162 start_codon:yes stop_codon:yes gene_type:complete